MPFTPTPHPGTLHAYAPRLVAFEHIPTNSKHDPKIPPHNFLLFLGGLCDALLTVRYPSTLATLLPPTWSIAEIQTRSSGVGYATGSLERDAEDIAKAVAYFRDLAAQRAGNAATKLILFGHSTGCQDSMNYLVGPWKVSPMPRYVLERPGVDGVILQAGISDREGVLGTEGELPAPQVEEALALARRMIEEGKGNEHMPVTATRGQFGAQMTAERWVSLMSEDGDDDYFSSDLGEERVERVWGAQGLASRGVKTLALLSGEDENFPRGIDKMALVGKWETYVKGSGGAWDDRSGTIPGAYHNLNGNGEEVVKGMCETVLGFVESVDPELAHKDVGKL